MNNEGVALADGARRRAVVFIVLTGLELAVADQPEVLDRARRRLGDRNEPAHPIAAATLAGRPNGWARDCAGDKTADLEEAAPVAAVPHNVTKNKRVPTRPRRRCGTTLPSLSR